MKNKTKIISLTLAIGGLLACGADAQTHLNWSTLDAGGGSCSGGNYSLSATVGQPDAVTMRSGSFSLAGGFWAGVVTEPGPPLHITTQDGSIILSWMASPGFHLQHCSSLTNPAWVSNASPALTFGADKIVVEPANNPRFYRLIKP